MGRSGNALNFAAGSTFAWRAIAATKVETESSPRRPQRGKAAISHKERKDHKNCTGAWYAPVGALRAPFVARMQRSEIQGLESLSSLRKF
jgi:hypothetical protein